MSKLKQLTVRLPDPLWKAMKIGLIRSDLSFQEWLTDKVEHEFTDRDFKLEGKPRLVQMLKEEKKRRKERYDAD